MKASSDARLARLPFKFREMSILPPENQFQTVGSDNLHPRKAGRYHEIRRAVFPIFCIDTEDILRTLGTGFFLSAQDSKRSVLITAAHIFGVNRLNYKMAGGARKLSNSGLVPNIREVFIKINSGKISFGTNFVDGDDIRFVKRIGLFGDYSSRQDPSRYDEFFKWDHDIAIIELEDPETLPLSLSALNYDNRKRIEKGVKYSFGFSNNQILPAGRRSSQYLLQEGPVWVPCYPLDFLSSGTRTAGENPTPVIKFNGLFPNGMSGAPIFDENGNTIGVVSSASDFDNEDESVDAFASILSLLDGSRLNYFGVDQLLY